MANYATLKTAIADVIKTNGTNAITGALLQQCLLSMVDSLGTGYQYMGIATPTTNPGTPDQRVFYLAATAGTYTNFGGLVLNGRLSILKYTNSWSVETINLPSMDDLNGVQTEFQQLKAGTQIPVDTGGIYGVVGSYVYIRDYSQTTPIKITAPTTLIVVDNDKTATAINIRYTRNGTDNYQELGKDENIFSYGLQPGDILQSIYGSVGSVSQTGTYTITIYEKDIVEKIQTNKSNIQQLNGQLTGLNQKLFKDYRALPASFTPANLLNRFPWNGLIISGGGDSSLVSGKIFITPNSFIRIIASGWYGYGLYAIYDKDDNYIAGEFSNSGGNVTNINKIICVPSNAAYIRVSSVYTTSSVTIVVPAYISITESGTAIPLDGNTNQLLGRSDNPGAIVSTSASYWVSELKQISPNTFYQIKGQSHYGYGLYAFYDENQNFITGEWSNMVESYTTINKRVLSPANAKYVRTAYIDPTTSIKSSMLTQIVLTEHILADSFLPYVGKKWAAMGDSLTEVNSRTTLHYHDYVAQVTGITVVNLGISGTGYAKSNPFYDRINTIPADTDVLTVFGSFNDLSSGLPLGEISDTGTTTICGCINQFLTNLWATYPTINIGIVTPTPWNSATPWGSSAVNYCQAIVDICKKYSIPCLDLFHCSNLRPWDETFRQLAYSHDDGNGVHPDELGHKLIAPRFEEFIKSLLLN